MWSRGKQVTAVGSTPEEDGSNSLEEFYCGVVSIFADISEIPT